MAWVSHGCRMLRNGSRQCASGNNIMVVRGKGGVSVTSALRTWSVCRMVLGSVGSVVL